MSQPHPLFELLKARLREFYREPAIVFWVFGFPLLMAVGLGIAFRSKPPERPSVTVAIAPDWQPPGDQATQRRDQLASTLANSPRVQFAPLPPQTPVEELSPARYDVVVLVQPEGVAYRFDPKSDTGPSGRLVVDDVLQRAAGRLDPLPTEERQVTRVGARYIDFLIPGLIGLNLMGSSMWGVGYNLVVARKRRLLRRYAVTPMRRHHFLLSYVLSRGLFLVLELTFLVAFGNLFFGTQVEGSYATLALFGVLGAGSFAGISLLIGSRLDNTETANGWMNVVQLPMWVLSGAFFSYEKFPQAVHPFIEALPLTAVVNAMRAIYNDGASPFALGSEALVLVAWGSLGFFAALRGFKWQ